MAHSGSARSCGRPCPASWVQLSSASDEVLPRLSRLSTPVDQTVPLLNWWIDALYQYPRVASRLRWRKTGNSCKDLLGWVPDKIREPEIDTPKNSTHRPTTNAPWRKTGAVCNGFRVVNLALVSEPEKENSFKTPPYGQRPKHSDENRCGLIRVIWLFTWPWSVKHKEERRKEKYI